MVFNGLFGNGVGHYTLTYRNNGTFDFDETVITKCTATTGTDVTYRLWVMSMPNATVNNEDYTGTETLWMYDYDYLNGETQPATSAQQGALTAMVASRSGFYGFKTLQQTGTSGFANIYGSYTPIPPAPPDYTDPNTLAIINGMKTNLVPNVNCWVMAYDVNGTWQPMIVDNQSQVQYYWGLYVGP